MTSPLSQSQLGVYYACLTTVNDLTNYQNAFLFTLPQTVNLDRLREAVYGAMCAHPYLMGRIVLNSDGAPEHESGTCPALEDCVTMQEVKSIEEVRATFSRTMDIYGERLYRCEIYKTPQQNYLYLDIHHLLLDGFTLILLFREIERLYAGEKAVGEQMDGAAIAQAEEILRADKEKMETARQWYANTFCDAADTDSLPIKETVIDSPTSSLCYKYFSLSVSKEDVHAVVQRFGAKESTVWQAAFGLLLATYGAEDKASWCTAWMGRTDQRMMTTATMMVHTLPVWMQMYADMPVARLLSELREQMKQTQNYGYYAYQDAVRDLGLNNRVMFAYQGTILVDNCALRLAGEMIPYEDLRLPTPGWNLCVELLDGKDGYSLKMAYDNAEYSDAFIRELAECYSTIVRSMTTAEHVRDLECCSATQKEWLNRLNPEKPLSRNAGDDTLVARFMRHVAEHPDAICVVAGDKRLTYAEVDRLSDTVNPEYTVRCGEHVIGYTVPRNEQMVIVPLSIAKAGKTAMPLDGSYPEDRLAFMREDATRYEGGEAFILLYTSGTTGTPKGVMLSERNIMALCDFHVPHIGLTPDSRFATYAGYGFDAFMQDLWNCLTAGAAIHVIGDDIRFDLEGIKEYFIREGITHTFITTQVATQMVQLYPDIPGLQFLGTGGEKLMSVEPPTYKLLNEYGPTECTVYVCSHWVENQEANIPIGTPNMGTELFIVNKYGKQVPWGAAGELIVAGEQVGLGYLNQPEKTRDAFVEWNGKRVYRTGDIVRYRADGKIEFVGRKDGQVKIRGFRIELKEVEAVIREYTGIKDATVQAFDAPSGGKFIAAYIVSDEKVDIQALNAFIGERKPPYMIPAATMQIDAIPLNQNQKVNRRALPKPVMQAQEDTECVNAPLNILEQQLKQMVVDCIGSDNFGLTTPLQYVGLTSILAIRLATQIYKRFGVSLDTKQMVHTVTIQTIENEILEKILAGEATKEQPQDSNLSSSIPSVPLSYAQTGVYFDCMKNPTSTIYNIPMWARMPKCVTPEQLEDALRQVAANHPELFVHFHTNDTEVIQEVEMSELNVERVEKKEEELETYRAEFVRPFNLSKDRLCRFSIVQTEAALYLYCDMHHLVCDGASYDIFFKELCTLLNGQTIEPELSSYAQFVQEEKAAEKTPAYEEAKAFFHSRLGDVEGVTEISSDLTNPQNGQIGQVHAPMDLSAAERLAHETGVSTASVALAAVFYALSRYANTEQVCITTISNGRSKLQMAQTIGMLVNTLALSTKIGQQHVREFLKETGDRFEQTLRHEYYPFAQIAADYDLTAEIMFAYQIGVLSDYKIQGVSLRPESMELNVPKFKIAFYIMEVNGTPAVMVEYDNGRYSQAMMQSLAESVAMAVTAFAKQPDAPLTTVSLLSDKQTLLLDSFNQTDVDYDNTQTIVSLFKAQVAKTPDNIAVVYHDKQYTYRQVDEISDRIAANLHPTTNVIAVKVERNEWMVIGSLAVLKTGCAYMPLDPTYPEERLAFMQKDGNSCMLLTEKELAQLAASPLADYHAPSVNPHDLFILLYTSGSTGVPKGCQIEHANVVAFCHWYQRYYELKAGDRVAAYASYGFDACMMDLYPALTCGATVYIIGEDIRLNLPDLNDYFNANGITHSFITTQVGYQFATNVDNHSLRHFSVGGEKLSSLNPPVNYQMHNGYGPTECTVFTTTYPLHEYQADIPIGKPVDNMRLYIVDKQFNRLPLGAAGELWVSGPQVSRGYLNRPEKNAETYLVNPFTTDAKYARIYRTGDIVRYMPDGNIQFVGRRDGQVKIRGFRIELKEVEAVIREYPGIKDATVQAFDYENGGKYIAAYIVSDDKVDIKALHAFIKERKPPYMVPAATMQIDSIPLNQNQKVNRKALPAPVMQQSDRDYVAPANEQERLFAKIFADILMIDKVGATDNFFDLGGTSLMVTRVIIEADKAGLHVAYGDIFANPTPRQLALFVAGGTESEKENDAADFDYTAINSLLQQNTMEAFMTGERQALGNVLLTGSTGYLGIHVLRELIDSDAERIYCMVRGETVEKAESRLRTLLYYYFSDSFKTLFGKRLFVVTGDVTSELDTNLKVDTVFNCAANVKHFSKGTDIEDVNIGGAQHCVDFCLKTGARLVHVSTTSVGGLSIDNVPAADVLLTEQNLFFGQYLGNQYMYSKFIADRLILDAAAKQGLSAKVMRVGNLSARSTDGEFQVNFQSNSYMGRIKVYNMLGCCPYELYDTSAEFSPINETAKAIVLLATTPKPCVLFHPYNNHVQLLGDILTQLGKITGGVRFVETSEFVAAMEDAKNDPQKAKTLSSLLAYQNLGNGHKTAIVERTNTYTSAVLHRLGFYWSPTSWDYDQRMLTAIAGMGFFE